MRVEPAAGDLTRRLRLDARLLGAVELERSAQYARVAAQKRAERHVVEHAHRCDQLHVLERAPDAQPRDLIGRPAADRGAAEAHVARAESQCATDQVEHRALSRAVWTDQAEDLAGPDLERQIVHRDQPAKPLACRIDLEQRALAGGLATRGQRRSVRHRWRSTLRQQALEPWPDSLARTLQQQHHQHAEDDDLEIAGAAENVRQQILQPLLEQRDQRRTDHRAPDTAGAADDCHEQVFDTLVDPERAGVDEALQVRVQPPRNAREQPCIDEHDDLQPRRVDAECLDHLEAALQRADRPAGARVEQIAARP